MRSAAACAPSAALRRRSVMEGGPCPLLASAPASGSPARSSSTKRVPPYLGTSAQAARPRPWPLRECGSRPRDAGARAAGAGGWGPRGLQHARPDGPHSAAAAGAPDRRGFFLLRCCRPLRLRAAQGAEAEAHAPRAGQRQVPRRPRHAERPSQAHEIAVETVEKKSLSPFNDKVYGLDAHNSRPLGHWRNLELATKWSSLRVGLCTAVFPLLCWWAQPFSKSALATTICPRPAPLYGTPIAWAAAPSGGAKPCVGFPLCILSML